MNKLSFVFLVFSLIFILGCIQQAETQPIITSEEPTQQATEEVITETIEEQAVDAVTGATVQLEEFLKHNTEEDCWIVYEGKIYDYTDAPRHPNMDKVFFQHCGKPSGFEEGAKAKHSGSSEERVANFGTYIGDRG
jgi:predicted heme/steroid binding protein